MRKTRYNLDFIVRLTGWANIIAWLTLGIGIIVGIGYVLLAVNTFLHPEAFAARIIPLPGQLGYTDAIVQQILRGIQSVAAGFATFIFLKGMPEALYILVDFEENTRPAKDANGRIESRTDTPIAE